MSIETYCLHVPMLGLDFATNIIQITYTIDYVRKIHAYDIKLFD